jgi:hypothetical protein
LQAINASNRNLAKLKSIPLIFSSPQNRAKRMLRRQVTKDETSFKAFAKDEGPVEELKRSAVRDRRYSGYSDKKQSALAAQIQTSPTPFARRRSTDTNSPAALVIATRGSRHASAPPPEKQRDYEQHKKYKKQQFCNARRCNGNTAKSQNRCYKCDD